MSLVRESFGEAFSRLSQFSSSCGDMEQLYVRNGDVRSSSTTRPKSKVRLTSINYPTASGMGISLHLSFSLKNPNCHTLLAVYSKPGRTPPRPLDIYQSLGYELDYDGQHERHTVDPFHRCLLHPPSRGKIEPGAVEFKIVDWVEAGDPNSSQVVAVRILNSTLALPTDVDILAKIYDPLYFNHIQDFVDIFQYNDFCYRRATAAYKHLADLQGGIVPKYYGSFTTSVPVDGDSPRDVRLILLEIVPGPSMDKLDPSSFKQEERQEIMKAIVDSERAVYAHKVANGDMHPRNILLPPDPSDRGCRAVIVDFGISSIIPDNRKEYSLPGVTRTAQLFHCLDTYNFWEWIDWDWDAWINEVYADIKGSSITESERRVLSDYHAQKVQSANDRKGRKYTSRIGKNKPLPGQLSIEKVPGKMQAILMRGGMES